MVFPKSHFAGTLPMAASVAILAGCATGPVLEQRLGQVLPNDASASYDAPSDTVTLSKGGSSVVLAKTGTVGAASLFGNAGDTSNALYMETASGKGKVVVFSSQDTDLGLVGAIASRDAEVTLPTSGTAAFNGGYEGLIVRASDKVALTTTQGTTCLTANFGASSISGGIISRSTSAADIVIPSTSLSAGGVFSGPVTGGQFSSGTASNGRIAGMFADVGAGEIVGALQLDHNISGADFYEVGGFTTVAGAGVCP